MKNKKKAALELSTSFIVSLILGIIMFSMGMVFVYRILTGVDKIKEYGLPNSFDSMANDCVQRGNKVCIPIIKNEIGSTKTGSFGVVINNIYGSKKNFKPIIKFSKGILEDETEITGVDASKWTFPDFKERIIENNKYEIVEIPIKVPPGTKAGTYVFNVNICFNSNDNIQSKCPSGYPSLYDNTQQITIVVP